MMIKTKLGNIVYNDISNLKKDPQKNTFRDIYSLKEDLLQINFEAINLILDVGWYPEFDQKGSFIIKVIKNFNWDNPVVEKKAKTLEKLYEIINQEIQKIEKFY